MYILFIILKTKICVLLSQGKETVVASNLRGARENFRGIKVKK